MRVLLAVLLASTLACGNSEVSPDGLPPEIAPLPGARGIDARMGGGDAVAIYTVVSSYPAEEVFRSIEANLAPDTWQPREFDHLNPTIPTSHVRGWTNYYDEPKRAWVHHWSSEWQNRAGAIVSYDLQYISPGTFDSKPEAPVHSELQVYANYISAETAERYKAEAEQRNSSGT